MVSAIRHLLKKETHKGNFFLYHPHSYGIATLMRIGFRIRGRQFMLHHFRPHQETEFHDHPWSFRTFVLWGSYKDESLWDDGTSLVTDVLRPGSTRHRDALYVHRTGCTGHVITFVVTSKKQRQWCQGTPEHWVCGGEVEDFDSTRGMVKV